MKKIIVITFLLITVLSLGGCGKDEEVPVINLVDTKATITLEAGIVMFKQPVCSVTDNKDKDIECVIGGETVDVNTPGTYTLTFNATDNAGNQASTKTLTVNVVDTIPPKLSFDNEVLKVDYIDEINYDHLTYTDKISDVTISHKMIREDNRSYIEYTAVDQAGNETEIRQELIVEYQRLLSNGEWIVYEEVEKAREITTNILLSNGCEIDPDKPQRCLYLKVDEVSVNFDLLGTEYPTYVFWLNNGKSCAYINLDEEPSKYMIKNETVEPKLVEELLEKIPAAIEKVKQIEKEFIDTGYTVEHLYWD